VIRYIGKMYISPWKPPGVSERMWSVNLEASVSGEYSDSRQAFLPAIRVTESAGDKPQSNGVKYGHTSDKSGCTSNNT
jgi:hypothetical protein